MKSARETLADHGLRPKKSWGQNFLSDDAILERIAEAADVRVGDAVVELGAGMGHLTSALARTGASVIAVEKDRDLVKVLERDLRLPNVRVLSANAATLDFAAAAGVARPTVVGNLPYQLSGRILFAVFEQHATVRRAVFTLQKEVGDRIASPPGGRDYGLLSVLLQAVGRVERLFDIPAGAFHPPPKVDSCVVLIQPHPPEQPLPVDAPWLARVVKGAFASRRKTLINTLGAARLLPRERVLGVLRDQGIDAARRAETLSPDEFVDLAAAMRRAASPLGEGASAPSRSSS